MLKYLTVSVVDILDKIYKKIGIPQHNPNELVEICGEKEYSIYSRGQTFEVNQMTSPRTVKYLEQFKPKDVYDISTVVAIIRPGAMSVVDRMMARKDFTYNSKIIDTLLSKHTGSSPAIIYQESIMELLFMSGIDIGKSYEVIKAISKKNKDVIMSAKEQFISGIAKLIMEDAKNN